MHGVPFIAYTVFFLQRFIYVRRFVRMKKAAISMQRVSQLHFSMYTFIHTYVHIRTYIHTYKAQVHAYIRTSTHTYICTYIYMYICTYVHTYIGCQ